MFGDEGSASKLASPELKIIGSEFLMPVEVVFGSGLEIRKNLSRWRVSSLDRRLLVSNSVRGSLLSSSAVIPSILSKSLT